MHDLINVARSFIAFCGPMLLTTMIPRSQTRFVAALFALIGIGFFVACVDADPTPYMLGFLIGFVVGSAKLLTGIRYL